MSAALSLDTIPYDEDKELIVLSFLVWGNMYADLHDHALEVINNECFHLKHHRALFDVMMKLYDEHGRIDIMLVEDAIAGSWIEKKIESSWGNLMTMLDPKKVPTTEATRYTIDQILNIRKLRMSHRLGLSLQSESSKFIDADEMLTKAEDFLSRIQQGNETRREVNAQQLVTTVLSNIEARRSGIFPMGLSPACKAVADRVKYLPGDLIVIAARPSMGKTAYALSEMIEQCKEQRCVGFISLETQASKLGDRILSNLSGIALNDIKSGANISPLASQRIDQAALELNGFKLLIDETGDMSISKIMHTAKRWKRMHKLDILIIDYMQLVNNQGMKFGTREQEVSYTSRQLKLLAQSLKIPVMALSQLSRKVEDRKVPRPVLSDLRESGAIEQDADIVQFLYRPEHYGIQVDEQGKSTASVCEVITAKNRDGEVGVDRVMVQLTIQKFSDYGKDYTAKATPPVRLEGGNDTHSPF